MELEPSDECEGMIDVAYDYNLDTGRFSRSDWNALEQIFAALPEPKLKRTDKDYLLLETYWSGEDDNGFPYLQASTGQMGLEVYGTLPLKDWVEWDEQFRQAVEASSLPFSEYPRKILWKLSDIPWKPKQF